MAAVSSPKFHDALNEAGGGDDTTSSPPPNDDDQDAQNQDNNNNDNPNYACDDDDNEVLAGLDLFRSRTLFINNLQRQGLQNTPCLNILKEVDKSYPLEIGTFHGNYIKLIFHDKEVAEMAAGQTINVNGKEVTLSHSINSPFITKTLHVYGVPVEVPDHAMCTFLNTQGMKVIFPGRFIKWSGTNINTAARSFVVQVKRDTIIPARLQWQNKNFKRGSIRVRLWYHGMPQYCKSCFQYGHDAENCVEFPPLEPGISEQQQQQHHQRRPRFPSFRTRATNSQTGPFVRWYTNDVNFEKLCTYVGRKIEIIRQDQDASGAQSDPESTSTDSLPMPVPEGAIDADKLPAEAPNFTLYTNCNNFLEAKRKQTFPFGDQREMAKTPFWSGHKPNGFLSNFHIADPILIWGESFSSVEKFLGVMKARLMGDSAKEDNHERK